MRTPRTEAQGAREEAAPVAAIEAGAEAKTQFHAQGTIPPVGAPPSEAAPAERPSASDLAFGGGGGGGRAAAGAGAGGGGKPLPDELRAKFESSLGADLSAVRIHTDSADAKSSGAKAVAKGQDIHVAPGQYDPHGAQGQELLAHEVAHTVQQKDAPAQVQPKAEMPGPASAPERDADQAATKMVAGERAQVAAVAEQAPHAKEDPTWKELITAIDGSLKKQDWQDVARRLQGFSTDDIAWYAEKKMSDGQRSHVREAAEIAMPGYSQRVTEQIDKVDSNAAGIAALYAAYEKAVVASRASGDWHEPANRLNGMGDWDIKDRLGRLTWFDYEGLRAANPTKRVSDAITVADAARVTKVFTTYTNDVAQGKWQDACAQLDTMATYDIESRLPKLEFTQLTAMRPYASERIGPMLDKELHGRSKSEQTPDGTKPTQVDGLVDVTPPLVALPDFSDDPRTPKEAHDAGPWGGSAKLKAYVEQLASAYADRAADAKIKKEKLTQPREAIVESIRVQTLHGFENQWRRVINEYQLLPKQWPKFSIVARYFCSDIGQGRLFKLDPAVDSLQKLDITDDALNPETLEAMAIGGSSPVRKITNSFIRAISGKAPAVNSFINYPGHGVGELAGQGYCVDLMYDFANSAAGRNDEGFVPRESALQVIHNIAWAADQVGGDWRVCYNDESVAKAAQKIYGSRIAYAGTSAADDTKEKVDNNGHGWHGPLNLHFHVDIVPSKHPKPPKADGDPKDAGKTAPDVKSPVGTPAPTESTN